MAGIFSVSSPIISYSFGVGGCRILHGSQACSIRRRQFRTFSKVFPEVKELLVIQGQMQRHLVKHTALCRGIAHPKVFDYPIRKDSSCRWSRARLLEQLADLFFCPFYCVLKRQRSGTSSRHNSNPIRVLVAVNRRSALLELLVRSGCSQRRSCKEQLEPCACLLVIRHTLAAIVIQISIGVRIAPNVDVTYFCVPHCGWDWSETILGPLPSRDARRDLKCPLPTPEFDIRQVAKPPATGFPFMLNSATESAAPLATRMACARSE